MRAAHVQFASIELGVAQRGAGDERPQAVGLKLRCLKSVRSSNAEARFEGFDRHFRCAETVRRACAQGFANRRHSAVDRAEFRIQKSVGHMMAQPPVVADGVVPDEVPPADTCWAA
jgi:hypothetical protein